MIVGQSVITNPSAASGLMGYLLAPPVHQKLPETRMANRPHADAPPIIDRISRFLKAVRRGTEAFREELKGAPGEGGRQRMDAYQGAIFAINRMDQMPRFHVDKRVIEAASEFVRSLRSLKIPVPDVGPSPDGGVAMAWTFGTPSGVLELDVVFLDWRRAEYREGFADRDGFVEDTVIDEEQLRERLLRAMSAAQHVA